AVHVNSDKDLANNPKGGIPFTRTTDERKKPCRGMTTNSSGWNSSRAGPRMTRKRTTTGSSRTTPGTAGASSKSLPPGHQARAGRVTLKSSSSARWRRSLVPLAPSFGPVPIWERRHHEVDNARESQGGPRGLPLADPQVHRPGGRVPVRAGRAGDGSRRARAGRTVRRAGGG